MTVPWPLGLRLACRQSADVKNESETPKRGRHASWPGDPSTHGWGIMFFSDTGLQQSDSILAYGLGGPLKPGAAPGRSLSKTINGLARP